MKKLVGIIFSFLLLAGSAMAEWTLKDWLKDLDGRLRGAEKKRHTQLVAAASVRGNKQDDAKKLYWKGRQNAGAVTAEELDVFKAAVGMAQEGKSAEAKTALEGFVTKYPSSSLKEDAQKTLALLSAAPAETPAGQ